MLNKIKDTVVDENGNPIVNVQVNIYHKGSHFVDSNIIMQEYTDPNGNWEFELKQGEYIIEYFHPKFNECYEEISVVDNKIIRGQVIEHD